MLGAEGASNLWNFEFKRCNSVGMQCCMSIRLPRHRSQLGNNFNRVRDTPAIPRDVMKRPMYALTTITCILPTAIQYRLHDLHSVLGLSNHA